MESRPRVKQEIELVFLNATVVLKLLFYGKTKFKGKNNA